MRPHKFLTGTHIYINPWHVHSDPLSLQHFTCYCDPVMYKGYEIHTHCERDPHHIDKAFATSIDVVDPNTNVCKTQLGGMIGAMNWCDKHPLT